MKLKKFSTEIFAGIKDRSYQFDEGLNILLGANEAGKSTIISAIYASLFVPAQIKLNRSEGIEFKDKYLPYPDGDYAAAELCFENDGHQYKFYKKWSNSSYRSYLELPDGVRIENPAKIKDYKSKILPYGKSTYNNIVFSSQNDIKSTLERISAEKNPELADTVSSFLRQAVMELDGISIDKFRSKLENEIDELTKKWDLESMSPANSSRGLNNPYKMGRGKIYDCYIEKEELRQKIKESRVKEKRFSELNQEIKSLNKKEKKLKEDIENLSELEEDISRRESLELKINNLSEKISDLKELKKKWPELKEELSELNDKKEELKQKIEKLESEKSRAEKIKLKAELAEKIAQIEELNKEIKNKSQEITDTNLSSEKVEQLEKYKNRMQQAEASLKAARLKAEINYSASDKIRVTVGVEEERESSAAEIIEADGYLRIRTDEIDIEIESAEIDFSALQKEYRKNKNKSEELKNELDVENLAEARRKLNKLKEAESEIKSKRERVKELQSDKNLEELKEEFKSFGDLEEKGEIKEAEEIERKIKEKTEKLNSLKTKTAVKENKLKEWRQNYDNLKKLKSSLRKKKENKAELNEELDNLSSLPQEFDSVDEFKEKLKDKRQQREEINQDLREKLQQLKKIENELPELSTSEMKNSLKELEADFKRLESRARSLLKIKKVFKNKLEEMDENSFEPLLKSFSQNLSQLTAGDYQGGDIDENLRVKLQSDYKKLPGDFNLLSYGTYDAAALALRFAIFDNLFKNKGGFIILDDCLVNLDPERRKKAVELIEEYQKDYQIIYTTCSPEQAEEFDANIIEL